MLKFKVSKAFNRMNKIKKRNHIYIILLCASIIPISFCIPNQEDMAIYLSGIKLQRLPNVCLFKKISGIECPSCGLTRSFISISNLKIKKAWYFHRVGILIYAFVVLQIPYRIYMIWNEEAFESNISKKIIKGYLYVIGVALIINWFFNLILFKLL